MECIVCLVAVGSRLDGVDLDAELLLQALASPLLVAGAFDLCWGVSIGSREWRDARRTWSFTKLAHGLLNRHTCCATQRLLACELIILGSERVDAAAEHVEDTGHTRDEAAESHHRGETLVCVVSEGQLMSTVSTHKEDREHRQRRSHQEQQRLNHCSRAGSLTSARRMCMPQGRKLDNHRQRPMHPN